MAIERQGYCPDHPDLPPARSRKLQRIVPPGCNIAYDVIAQIGLARFLDCRQCEEIQVELSRQHGIDVPMRTNARYDKTPSAFGGAHEWH